MVHFRPLLSCDSIYRLLMEHFGPQGWWPVTPYGSSSPRYFPGDYRKMNGREQWEICVGAILTQNTAWKNVEKALAALYDEGVMDVRGIMAVDNARLASSIRSSGYYNQKTVRLKNFAGYIMKTYNGRVSLLFDRPLKAVREELLGLSGIGPETADSMLLYAGGKPVFVIDAYTRRMGSRLGWTLGKRYEEAQLFFQRSLPRDTVIFNEYHALIVALGKDYCAARPRCEQCPLRHGCRDGNKK